MEAVCKFFVLNFTRLVDVPVKSINKPINQSPLFKKLIH